jgi:hypothetical protein
MEVKGWLHAQKLMESWDLSVSALTVTSQVCLIQASVEQKKLVEAEDEITYPSSHPEMKQQVQNMYEDLKHDTTSQPVICHTPKNQIGLK